MPDSKINFASFEYDKPRNWISEKHKRGASWDDIADHPHTSMPLDEFLGECRDNMFWPEMDAPTWKGLVRMQEEFEKSLLELESRRALVIDGTNNNNVTVPELEQSCWQRYKQRLLDNDFSPVTVAEIERATHRILRRLRSDTRSTEPVKGLVIGNVQSGKTANMAALMAMAADWGWNMFIILSGTIENLRIQTQERLFGDLNNKSCSLTWTSLNQPGLDSGVGARAQDLSFEEESTQRYFTVTLKNAARLRNLIQWLQKDKNQMGRMRILVIDDEADQAGINTADVDSSVRKTINELICALVNGLDFQASPIRDKYMAMNYIGYTATPYANILNESSLESLYPRNFLATLSVSKEYFGPQQIFGHPDGPYQGLDIVRKVTPADLNIIKDIHRGAGTKMPDSLVDAICWFACCVAARRLTGVTKPISMLIHTSQRVSHHEHLSTFLEQWVNHADKDELVERCRQVWETETARFPLDEFREQYPDYGAPDSLRDYPSFEEIEGGIRELFSVDLKPIKMNDSGEMDYHNGIHLCVDNSANNGTNDADEHLRLLYPDKNVKLDKAPAFLVIGGATLSRGLTLEGLVSTFFLRSVKQADTLMQMGRWFGYRRGYELYPRLWLTDNTKQQFEFLSLLDQDLRDEILMMDLNNLKPSEYAARVRNSPRLNLIRITAKNRMQKFENADMDFSGSFNQTYRFDDDKDVLEKNLEATFEFLEDLGAPRERKDCNAHASNATVWEGVPLDKVDAFLKKYKFCNELSVFDDIDSLLSWLRQITDKGNLKDWNVVLAGKARADGDRTVDLDNCSATMVTRTRKDKTAAGDKVIDIGVLRAPLDVVADVDLDGKPDSVKALFSPIDEKRVKEIRSLAGLDRTPQLLVYIVDKDSMPSGEKSKRKPLAAPCDIAGLCVNIPGGSTCADNVATVRIKLDNRFNDEGDLDGSNTEENTEQQ